MSLLSGAYKWDVLSKALDTILVLSVSTSQGPREKQQSKRKQNSLILTSKINKQLKDFLNILCTYFCFFREYIILCNKNGAGHFFPLGIVSSDPKSLLI